VGSEPGEWQRQGGDCHGCHDEKTQRTAQRIAPAGKHRWLGIALIALGLGLIANSLLGPFVVDAIRYPLSESVLNQTTGLETVSLLLIAPLCIFGGVLAIRGRAVAPLVAFGPAAYTAYMFLQYVVGPEYRYYPRVLPMHLALFTLGGGITVAAWSAIDREHLPRMTRRSEQRYGVLLLVLAAFIISRYLPALFAGLRDDPLPAEFRDDVSMYWSIFLLDLGVVVPATIAAAVALIRGTDWGRKALYVVFGWFALVPPSVAAMAIVMVAKDDPNASEGQAIVLTVVALLFAALAVRLYRPMIFGRELHEISPSTSPAVGTAEARQLVLGSGVEHLAKNHLEDAAVSVIVHLGGHVDPNSGRERDVGAVVATSPDPDLPPGLDPAGQPSDGERLTSAQAE
jgi:hypothetical protein